MVVQANPTVRKLTVINREYGVTADEYATDDGNPVTTVIHPFMRLLPVLFQ
jgi:hypothetical protein